MKIINVKEYVLNEGTDVVIDLCNNLVGDTVVGEVYFQTTEDFIFTVKATVDGTHFNSVKLFDLGNMGAISQVASAGVYLINAAGYKAIKVIPGVSVANEKITVKTTF